MPLQKSLENKKIIEAEKPHALLPTMGGQTALNMASQLSEQGILEKYGVKLIGASYEAIQKADAALAASIFHFGEIKIEDLKSSLRAEGIPMRMGN